MFQSAADDLMVTTQRDAIAEALPVLETSFKEVHEACRKLSGLLQLALFIHCQCDSESCLL